MLIKLLKVILISFFVVSLSFLNADICSSDERQKNPEEKDQEIISKLKATFATGQRAFVDKDYHSAADTWRTCLEILSNYSENRPDKIKYEELVYFFLAEAYRELARTESAEDSKYFSKALSSYRKIDKFVGVEEDDVHLNISYLYENRGLRLIESGMYSKAKQYHKKALASISKVSKKYQLIKLEFEAKQLRSLGLINAYLGNYDEAEQKFTSALTIWRQLSREDEILIEKSNYTGLLIEKGQIIKARNILQNLLKEIEDSKAISAGDAYLNLGNCHYILGNYGEAGKRRAYH